MKLKRINQKFIFNNLFFILLVLVSLLTLFVIPTKTAFAENIDAKDVEFTPDDSNWEVDNVNDALDGMYKMIIEDQLLKTLETTHGTLSPSFDPLVIEYNLDLDLYDRNFVLTGETYNASTTVTGLDETYILSPGQSMIIELTTTDEEGEIRVYTINAKRAQLGEGEHSSKLENIVVSNEYSELDPVFYPLTESYDIFLFESDIDLDLELTTIDPNATYTISGDKRITELEGTVTITVHEDHCDDTIYYLNYTKGNKDVPFFETGYSGEYKVFEVEKAGVYQIELWGASGGNVYATYIGEWPGQENLHGKGAYTSGEITLKKNDKLYIFVGEAGMKPASLTATVHGGWNGGGSSQSSTDNDDYGGTGGGATDVRLVPTSSKTIWNEFDSLKSRIMVAGGGGGSAVARNNNYSEGMNAGGLAVSGMLSSWSAEWTPVVNQTTGNAFGVGANGIKTALSAGGGGGGYYGGVQRGDSSDSGRSSGGSSYISGHAGSNSVSSTSTASSITHTGSSIHHTGVKFENTQMVDGTGYKWTTARTTKTGMPTIDGTSTENGHNGNGYAKITLKELLSKDNYLVSLSTDKGTISPAFDPLVENYTLTLDVDDTKLNVSARPSSDLATINGIGEYDIPGGVTIIPITVTSESGDKKIYKITVTRPYSSESRAKDIIVTGLVEKICVEYPGYCEITPDFNPNTDEYSFTVPSGIRDIEFTVDKMHAYETIVGDGVTKLLPGDNTISIEVTSEDGLHQSLYTFNVLRDNNDDNYIDNLVVKPIDENNNIGDEIDIGFNYLLTEYSIKVANDITKLDLDITLDDPVNARVVSITGNDAFEVGSNIVEIEVESKNHELRSYILNVYRVSNNNPLLQTLEVTSNGQTYQLSPEFKDVQSKYNVVVPNDVTTVIISGTTQKDTTTAEGFGEKTLNVGNNKYTILSTAENGMTFTYEVNVYREKNSNNYLSTLSVAEGSLSPAFDKEEPNYSITVEPHTKSLTITALPEVNTSNVQITGNSNFSIGENVVRIRVIAEDNSVNDYFITVTKEGSDNNYLQSLTIGNIEYTFDRETPEYEFNVDNSVTSISILGVAEDSLSTVAGNKTYNLNTGFNEITIKVTSETGIDRNYVVKITRAKNSNAYLSGITISAGSISFDKYTPEYTFEVENNIQSITVQGTPEEATTTVSGNNTYNLISGQEETINLVTLAEDEVTTLTYTLKVTRKKNENAYLKSLTVNEGIMHDSFEKTTYEYTMKVRNNIEHITLGYELDAETSNVVVTNPETLEVGENEITILVTSEKGNTNLYKITVTRLSEEDSKN